jgi:hypothetical protein
MGSARASSWLRMSSSGYVHKHLESNPIDRDPSNPNERVYTHMQQYSEQKSQQNQYKNRIHISSSIESEPEQKSGDVQTLTPLTHSQRTTHIYTCSQHFSFRSLSTPAVRIFLSHSRNPTWHKVWMRKTECAFPLVGVCVYWRFGSTQWETKNTHTMYVVYFWIKTLTFRLWFSLARNTIKFCSDVLNKRWRHVRFIISCSQKIQVEAVQSIEGEEYLMFACFGLWTGLHNLNLYLSGWSFEPDMCLVFSIFVGFGQTR